jgi:hypothetical protein
VQAGRRARDTQPRSGDVFVSGARRARADRGARDTQPRSGDGFVSSAGPSALAVLRGGAQEAADIAGMSAWIRGRGPIAWVWGGSMRAASETETRAVDENPTEQATIDERPVVAGAGLCNACRWQRVVVSGRGSAFTLCRRAGEDPRLMRYPPIPVRACPGYAPSLVGGSVRGGSSVP